MDDMISRAEAQDLLNAIGRQRDQYANEAAQIHAAFAKLQRESSAQIAELEEKLAAAEKLAAKPDGTEMPAH